MWPYKTQAAQPSGENMRRWGSRRKLWKREQVKARRDD